MFLINFRAPQLCSTL